MSGNLKAAELQLQHLSEVYRADGVTGHTEPFKEAWNLLRNARRHVDQGLELAGKEMAGKLVDSMPQHRTEKGGASR